MKKSLILVSLTLLLSTIGFGQSDKFREDPEDPKNQEKYIHDKKAPASSSDKKEPASDMEDVLLESGTSLDAKLLSTLDVKKSKVGDEVVLKTTKSIKQNGA